MDIKLHIDSVTLHNFRPEQVQYVWLLVEQFLLRLGASLPIKFDATNSESGPSEIFLGGKINEEELNEIKQEIRKLFSFEVRLKPEKN